MELAVDGRTLHYEDAGPSDAPPVVLLHGITQSSATWAWLVPMLTDRCRVVRLDFRGHGRSDWAPGEYTYPGYVADATALVEQVIGAPAVFVGHSLGGGTSVAMAQQRPDLVRGFVAEDPPLFTAAERLDNALRESFTFLRAAVPDLQASGLTPEDLAATMATAASPSGPTFAELLTDDGLISMAAGMLQMDASVLDPVLTDTIEPLFDPAVALTVPGVVLAADPASPDAVARLVDLERLNAASPHIETRVVAGSNHLMHDTRAHRSVVADAISSFVDSR